MNGLLELFYNRQFQNIAFTQLFTVFANNFMLPVLPVYLKLQGYAEGQIGIVMGVAALGALLSRPLAGYSVDTKGSRPVILFSQVMIGMGIIAFLWINTFLPMVLLRLWQGVAISFYSTAAITFASSVETPQNTSGAIALYSVFTMMGLGAATSTGPFLFTAMGFASLIITSFALIALAAAIMGLRAQSILPCPGTQKVMFMSVARSKYVLAPTVCLFASNFAFGTLFTFIPLLAMARNVSLYSVFYVAFTVAVICARLSVNQITRLCSVEKAATYASLLNALSVLAVAVHASIWTFLISGIFIGFGFGIVFPSLAVYVVNNTNPANKGTALGILSASGDIGTALGASVLGIVAELYGYDALFYGATLVVLLCTYQFYMSLVYRK